jgi:hypothetical protein
MIALQNMLKIPDVVHTAVVAVVVVTAVVEIVVVVVDTAVIVAVVVVVAVIVVVEAAAVEETDGKVFSLNSNINPKIPGKSYFPKLFSF